MAPARQRYSEAQAAISSNNLDLATAILLGERLDELTPTSAATVCKVQDHQEVQEAGLQLGVSHYRVRANLVDRLLLRGEDSSRENRFHDALKDLDKATSLQGETDRILALRNVILLGIEKAVQGLLSEGRVDEADRLIAGCLAGGNRWPALTALLELVQQVRGAERLSKQGRFVEAIHRIEAALSAERFAKVVETLSSRWRSMHDKLQV